MTGPTMKDDLPGAVVLRRHRETLLKRLGAALSNDEDDVLAAINDLLEATDRLQAEQDRLRTLLVEWLSTSFADKTQVRWNDDFGERVRMVVE